MAQETIKITELTALSNFTKNTLFVTHDGTGARKATLEQLLAYLPDMGNGPGSHNSIYRGVSLGTSVTADQYNAINAGTFDDMYIGDYWTIASVKYEIVAFDYYYRCGDGGTVTTETWTDGNGTVHTWNVVMDVQKHHVTLMPATNLYNAKMNETNTTNGGYMLSKMYRGDATYTCPSGKKYYTDVTCETEGGTLDAETTVTYVSDIACSFVDGTTKYVKTSDCSWTSDLRTSGLAQAKDTIINAFGDTHILCHRKYLVNGCHEGVPTSNAWVNSFCELPTEINMYGCSINAAVNSNNINHHRYTVDKTQFPLFRMRPDRIIAIRVTYRLQDISDSTGFALVYGNGVAYLHNASYSIGVRPVFSIVKS